MKIRFRIHVRHQNMGMLLGLILLSGTACTTSSLEVNLPSFHVMRPAAGMRDTALVLGGGLVQSPEVQGLAPAVRDADGKEINTVPDYQEDNPIFFKHGDYTTKTMIDLGINLKKRVDLGWSSSRGGYALINVLDLDMFTLTLSPAYYSANQLSRDRGTSLESGPKKYSARVFDRSLTALSSVFLGSRSNAAFVVYGGYGFHRIGLQVHDYRSEEQAAIDTDARTLLVGIGVDSRIGSLTIEEAWTKMRQRTGAEPVARSFAFAGTLYFGP